MCNALLSVGLGVVGRASRPVASHSARISMLCSFVWTVELGCVGGAPSRTADISRLSER